jgi:eukaryotic-like serine/threonine-protein kinase
MTPTPPSGHDADPVVDTVARQASHASSPEAQPPAPVLATLTHTPDEQAAVMAAHGAGIEHSDPGLPLDTTPNHGDPDVTGPYPAVGGNAVPALPASATVRYRVVRPLGKGGLGEVRVALDEQLNREVALKEIQAQHAYTCDSVARFLLEAEVTGRLEHPGVVPVYSLGRYADGRPYYAMRLIRGETFQEAIKRFHTADRPGRAPGERSLAFRALLRRLIDTCNAVAYAHNKGVLHRDLKPNNVMLGAFGETLVIDWGLAKVQGKPGDDPADDVSLLQGTRSQPLGQTGIAGTPAFMSPEQAEARLDELGPASDVYSLGAILYVLLTGRNAFSGSSSEQVLAQVRLGRFLPPCRVNAKAPRALEAVCLKAMALLPRERYAAAKELAADVEHWLADEPVSAYREPLRDRLRRWGRRNRSLVISLAALLLTATAALAVGLMLVERERAQTAQARDEERKAKEENKAALARSEAAEKSAAEQRQLALETLGAIISDISPELKDRPQLRRLRKQLLTNALEGLRKVARAADNGSAIDRAAIAVHFQLGDILLNIDGGLDEAKKQYDRAFDLATQRLAAEPQGSEAEHDLAMAYTKRGNLLAALGDKTHALQAFRASLAIRQRLAAADPMNAEVQYDLAQSYENVAASQGRAGDVKGAVESDREAFEIRKRLAEDYPDNFQILLALSDSYRSRGARYQQLRDYDSALELYREALAIRERLASAEPSNLSLQALLHSTHSHLGELRLLMGDTEAALNSFNQSLLIAQKVFQSDAENYARILGVAQHTVGNALRQIGDAPGAEEALRAALALRKQRAEANPDAAQAQNDLLSLYFDLGKLARQNGDLDQAIDWYRQAGEIPKKFPKPEFRADAALDVAVNLRECRTAAQVVENLDAIDKVPAGERAGVLTTVIFAHARRKQADRALAAAERLPKAAMGRLDDVLPAFGLARCAALADKPDLKDRCAARAMELLQQAVAKGFKDIGRIKKHHDLDALRDCADFKALLSELEAKQPKTPKEPQ